MTLREEVEQLSFSSMISTGLAYRIVDVTEAQQATISRLERELDAAKAKIAVWEN